ncbi:DUF1259 domain-containing protein [Chlamydiota bacterium]
MLKYTKYVVALLIAFFCRAFAQERNIDTAKIEQITQIKGTWNAEEEVFKISLPRTDVKVTIDGWEAPPFMGLTSWVAFKKSEDNLLAMGDLVLFEDEVNPVMSVALQNGLSITALHNHFFYDHPRVFFMHIEGFSDVEKLSSAIAKSFDEVKKIRSQTLDIPTSFGGPQLPPKSTISQKMIEDILQIKGQSQDGMVKVTVGRTTKTEETVGKEMGVNSWAAFAGTDENAVVDGDIAVLEDELENVLMALRKANINIVAIHNHMIHENPRVLFLHYWGKGPVKTLAESIKLAFGKTGGK